MKYHKENNRNSSAESSARRHSCSFFVKLNPTGKWLLRRTKYGEIKMDVQHGRFLFKWWISEDRIVYYHDAAILYVGNC